MNLKIDNKIKDIIIDKRIGFMGHIIASYPDYNNSLNAALGICESGADFLEIQFPFSDPTADGTAIVEACNDSLNKGFKIEDGFKLVEEVATKTKTIVLIMSYANLIFKYGVERFVRRAVTANASGLIIPDLPIENDEQLNDICKANNIANILLVAPGSDKERIKKISSIGDGFLYTVARRGITGNKTEIDDETKKWLKLVKDNSKLPIAVGFGIQNKEQIKQLKDYCQIVIIGSHFVKIIKEAYQKGDDLKVRLFNETTELLGI
jgi:tryptophan synthase alpha chain